LRQILKKRETQWAEHWYGEAPFYAKRGFGAKEKSGEKRKQSQSIESWGKKLVGSTFVRKRTRQKEGERTNQILRSS